MKLLVNNPQGVQELITVGTGGGYFDESRVLAAWPDDAELPEITLNGMELINGDLVFNQAKLNAYVAPVVVPNMVTMAQARKAIIVAGITIAAVDAALASIADPVERALAQADWEYATDVIRDNSLVTTIAPILGLNDAQLDQLFITAATL